jgi:hypothetical protein
VAERQSGEINLQAGGGKAIRGYDLMLLKGSLIKGNSVSLACSRVANQQSWAMPD